jgi:hypothetical protein
VAAIKEYGGYVRYDYEFVDDTYVPGQQPRAPAMFIRVLGIDLFASVAEVDLAFREEIASATPPIWASATLEGRRSNAIGLKSSFGSCAELASGARH